MSDTAPSKPILTHSVYPAHHFAHLDIDAVLTDRQQALQDWLNQHLNGDYDIYTLLGDASFRCYHRIVLADDDTSALPKRMLVMDAPPDKESVSQFVQVARLLAPVVNVPDILATDETQGFLLLQDFGQTEFAHLLSHNTEIQINLLYHKAMQSLIHIQSLEIEQTALPLYDGDMLSREMALFSEWFLPYLGIDLSAGNTQTNGSQLWQQLVAQIITEVGEHPNVVVHRDYHSRNLMLDDAHTQDQSLGIIDFQDAVIGSYVYDLVSLVRDAYVHWSESQVAIWTADFWQMLQMAERPLASKKRTDTGFEQYQKDIMTMGVQRHLKVLGIFVRLAQRDGKTRYLADIPKVMDDLLFELNWLATMDKNKYVDKQSQQTQQMAQVFLEWIKNTVLPAYMTNTNINHMANKTVSHVNIDKDWHHQPIRQAMILAAGKGTRLRPLTLSTPKPLINVGSKALIEWHIEALQQAGITDIVINCSWLADKLQAGIGDGSRYGVNIHWSVEERPLETAAGIAKALHDGKLKHAPFLVINGDVWTCYPLDKIGQGQGSQPNDSQTTDHSQTIDNMTITPLAHLLLVPNPEHNMAGDFIYQKGKALPKPDAQCGNPINDKQTWTFAGISLMHPALFADVPYDSPYPLSVVLKQAMTTNQVCAEIYDGIWVDVGTPERLAWVDEHIKANL